MENKRLFPRELALILGIIINSLSVTLIVKSNLGISPISSVPYVLSKIITSISFGTWNYIVQCSLIIILVAVTRKFKIGYGISFLLAILFGYLIDFFQYMILAFPSNLILDMLYYTTGFFALSFGICLLVKSRLPILPFDIFVLDMSKYLKISFKAFKTSFDITCIITTVALFLIFIGAVNGIGVGTILGAIFTGTLVFKISNFIDRIFYFETAIKSFSKAA